MKYLRKAVRQLPQKKKEEEPYHEKGTEKVSSETRTDFFMWK